MLGNPRSPSDDDNDERRWRLTLGLLVGIRALIPLVTLAFSGHALPGLPAYRYQPLNGDSFVYYAAAREFIASFLLHLIRVIERTGTFGTAPTSLAHISIVIS